MERRKLLDEIRQELGIVPGWLAGAPDDLLASQWAAMRWMRSNSALTSREKALIAYGVAASLGCPYSLIMHTEQLRLSGANEEQFEEMSGVIEQAKGIAAYLQEEGYSIDQFRREIGEIISVSKKRLKG